MTNSKLPRIPTSEWITLAIGIILFGVIEVALFLSGYTNFLINSVAALILASVINYGIFGMKNKIKRVASAIKTIGVLFATAILAVPAVIAAAVLYALRAIPRLVTWIARGLVSFIKALPRYLITLLKFIGIALLNLAILPVLAVYLTIYGLIFSLSGSAAKIMIKHYDALGHRMIAPIEKYLNLGAVIFLITIILLISVVAMVLNGLQTSFAITAANSAAYNATGVSMSTFSTILSYAPVLLAIIVIVVIVFLLKMFSAGAGAFAMS